MNFRRLFDILPYQAQVFPKQAAFLVKYEYGWQSFSTEDSLSYINQIAAGLINLGVKRGVKIAIYASTNTPEWHFLDFAIQKIGAVMVSISSNRPNRELLYILKDADVQYCFVDNIAAYEQVATLKPQLPLLKNNYIYININHTASWEELLTIPSSKHLKVFESMKAAIHEDDIATIIYPQAFVDVPKGVMLSHKNMISCIKAILSIVPIQKSKRCLSFQALHDIFERVMSYSYMATGATLYYASTQKELIDTILEVKPHFFTSFPSNLEIIYNDLLKKHHRKSQWNRNIVAWAISVGKQFTEQPQQSFFYWLKWKLANRLVYWKWRKLLGGKVEGILVSTSHQQSNNISKILCAAGIPVKVGYGFTETTSIVTLNRFKNGEWLFNTVGKPLATIEAKIHNPDRNGIGEVWVSGDNIMLGYYKKPTITNAIITPDGWFKTGDMGVVVDKQFLKITGSKKDMFKAANGEYIIPQSLETHFVTSPLIAHILITGANRPYLSALIIPDFKYLKQWCQDQKIQWTNTSAMIKNKQIVHLFQQEIDQLNQQLLSHQRISKFQLLPRVWSIETGELNSTQHLQRKTISDKYQEELRQLYDQ